MADRGNKKWTEEEKMRFLVQAVKQLQAAGGKLDFHAFNLQGRTSRSLMHLWDKFAKDKTYSATGDNAEDAGEAGSEPATPARKRGGATSGSRKRTTKAAAIDEDGDAGEGPATLTLTAKRQRKTPVAKYKAKASAVAAAVDEDELEETEPEIKPDQDQNDLDEGEI